MKQKTRGRTAALVAGASGVVLSCGAIRSSSPTAAVSINACSVSPCQDYVQGNVVECTDGVCLASPVNGPAVNGLVAVVSLPETSYFAPGLTFAVPLSSIAGGADASSVPSGLLQLPPVASVTGLYTVTPQLAQTVRWDLGSPPGDLTSLPFHATFRQLWPQSDGTLVEAQALGLPIQPGEAAPIEVGTVGYPGPGGGPETEIETLLPPATYEQTLTPDPPFDQAFGPVTQVVALAAGSPPSRGTIESYDTTGGAQPQVEITREGGVFDGWTAYLRDSQTGRTISNLAPLSGSESSPIFAVKRSLDPSQADPDALSGAELVVAPPAGDPEPTGIFNLFDMLTPVLYPAVPSAVTVSGRVFGPDGESVDATVIFEATSLAVPNFEFTGSVTVAGGAAYSVALPPGQYQVDVRPSSGKAAVSILSSSIQENEQLNFVTGIPETVTGVVRIADERQLAGAMVDAIALQCPSAVTNSPDCLPRSATAPTDSGGSYTLALDPGSYTLRVRPAQGSHLPWIAAPQTLVVDGTDGLAVAPIIVPAPVGVDLTLADPLGNRISGAVIRIFQLPSQSTGAVASPLAIEVGQAFTGTDGSSWTYIAPLPF